MTPTIAIIGSALSGNKGAAAMLEAALQGLSARMPDARFVLLSMYPDEDRKLNHYSNLDIVDASPLRLGVLINSLALLHFLLPPLRKLIERQSITIGALAKADVMIDQGGITFADGREKFLLYNVASILPTMWLRTPIVKCAQAIGPFTNPVNRIVSKLFLPRVRLIVTRGRITQEHADSLGLNNTLAGADMAFTLDHGARNRTSGATGRLPRKIAVSPSVVMQKKVDAGGGDYAAEMASFVCYLVENDFQPVILPHSARTGTNKTHNNDLPLCHTVFRQIPNDKRETVELIEDEISALELRRKISECEMLVTSRFHAMVSGLATGTPTLVIGWSHKYEEVLEMFDATECAFSHKDFSQSKLRKTFERLWARRESLSKKLIENLPVVEAKATEQLDAITSIVRKG